MESISDMFSSAVETEEVEFSFAAHRLRLLCVHGENQNVAQFVPRVVWPSAEALSSWLVDQPRRLSPSTTVVELGSGTGLCGLLAAKLCGRCVLTDADEQSLALLRQNVALNALDSKCAVVELRWGDDAGLEATLAANEGQGFDCCLATDVIYEPQSVGPMLRSAHGLLRPGGELLLANHRHRFDMLEEAVDLETAAMAWSDVERLAGLGEDAAICFYKLTKR